MMSANLFYKKYKKYKYLFKNSFHHIKGQCPEAYPRDETVSTASSDSDNADQVDPEICQVRGGHFLVTCTLGSAALKQNTDGSGILLLKPVG